MESVRRRQCANPPKGLRDASSTRALIDIDVLADDLPDSNPGIAIASDAPLWVMYASGTTGESEGVLKTQRNLLHSVGTYAAGFSFGPATRLVTLTPRWSPSRPRCCARTASASTISS
jgi:acyl-CoA synthetase (AMP-forming)/AMP-acid ligase II